MRNWIVLSSSSGQTFQSVWRSLTKEAQNSFAGFFVDRPCEGLSLAGNFLPQDKIFNFAPPSDLEKSKQKLFFEEKILEWMAKQNPKPLVFLIGCFKILSPQFLECGAAVINTHPSLLPLFPGMDKKVHALAFEQSLVSGFSIHMVNEELDGGALIFQKAVDTSAAQNADELRDLVREKEQKYLPLVMERLLLTDLQGSDRKLTTRQLQTKLQNKMQGQKGFPLCVD